jgi:hypothetical protein
MKKVFGLWTIPGIAAGLSTGIAMKNILAGLALGLVTGLLLAMVQSSFVKN